MARKDRYDASNLPEAEWEPGSRRLVLRNLLGIKRKSDMDRVEAEALQKATNACLRLYSKDHRFTVEDLHRMHRLWLGDIYPWAGSYRNVNMSKGGFLFAVAEHIPKLMHALEQEVLAKCTPCRPGPLEWTTTNLARVHVEFVLVHPFREGNGRLARLLTTLMVLQADLPLLDFSSIQSGAGKNAYFKAVRAGMKKDYDPMAIIMKRVIEETLRRQA